MKNLLLILILITLASCRQKEQQEISTEMEQIEDSKELKEIYDADQADRKSGDINWYEVFKRDSLRRVRVHQLLDSNKVSTARDYKNAAMVFQHGKDSSDYGMAVRLMKEAIELDSTTSKWLLAAATDRYLLSKGEPQIYGTQYHKMGDEPWKLADIDTTKISDDERIRFGVETLAQQRETVKQMNIEEGEGYQ